MVLDRKRFSKRGYHSWRLRHKPGFSPKSPRSTESDKLIGETSRFTCRNGHERNIKNREKTKLGPSQTRERRAGETWKRGSQAPVRSRSWPELPSQVKEAYPRP